MQPKPYPLALLLKAILFLLLAIFVLGRNANAQAANNTCTNAVLLVSGTTCSPVTGNVNNANVATPNPAICGGGTIRYDVWYRFVAQSRNPIIQLGSIGAGFINPKIQVLSGNCTGMTVLECGEDQVIATTALELTVGVQYYIRLYSSNTPTPTTTGSFTICIVDPPAPVNDEPAGAINLTSAVGCVNTAANIGNATYDVAAAATCGGTPRYDVWYTFTAERVNPAITISGTNADFNAPRIQVFSGTPGSLTSIGCNTSPYTPTNLTVGETYYIRVYSTSGTAWPNATTGAFNICINNAPRPANDACAGATLINQNATCGGTAGNLIHALPTSGVPGDCGDPNSPDVWYRFSATSSYPEITVSGAGAAFMAAGLRVQLFSGTCGSLTPIACNLSITNRVITGPTTTPLTIGQIYYIRVSSNGSVMNATTWNFSICVTNAVNPEVHFGKTYANISKGNGGGTIEPGDILEIRAVLNIRSGAMFHPTFTDNIPVNTTYVPGTLRILTNEGKIFRQWTDAADSDPANITGSAVTINLGNGATAAAGGSIRTSDRPIANGVCILVISYRVQVNAVSHGTLLQMGFGAINYSLVNGTPAVIGYASLPATVYPNYGICTNTIGTNGILSEFGGTFGAGVTKDRAASTKVPSNYMFTNFSTSAPGDYYYGVSNNTSANNGVNYSIDPNDPILNKRVFNFWDIIGDHTGAADPLAGNLPADVNNGASGGYMVVINAAYRADTAFQDTVRNLCPNTSYEYSAWFRNICRKCGIDSTGTGSAAAGYIPTGPADSAGVRPNLTFNINGSDYYSTGDILYTGQWIKKGFTYRTGPTETEMIINIRNNAAGGGGNDWAIDDIGVATCSPALVMNPATPIVNVCYGDGQSVSAEVISYYDNFTHYIWERSVDSGANWIPTGHGGTSTAAFNGTEYQYTAVGPSFIGDSTTHNNQFRLRVASSAANLADVNCSFRAVRTIVVRVNNCMWVLKTKLITVTGTIKNTFGVIDWKTSGEEPGVEYVIEKSSDGTHYSPIGTVKGKAAAGFAERYQFIDPVALKASAYYRIRIVEHGQSDYSKVILLSPYDIKFEVRNVLNPFANQVRFDIIAPAEGQVRISIMDNYGRVIRTINQAVAPGITPVRLSEQSILSNGVYGLKVEYGNSIIIKRMVKAGN